MKIMGFNPHSIHPFPSIPSLLSCYRLMLSSTLQGALCRLVTTIPLPVGCTSSAGYFEKNISEFPSGTMDSLSFLVA